MVPCAHDGSMQVHGLALVPSDRDGVYFHTGLEPTDRDGVIIIFPYILSTLPLYVFFFFPFIMING